MVEKFFYDKENDILSIHKGFSADEKFKGNIDIGNLILDVSTKGRIRGIEIINVTKLIKNLGGIPIEKHMLENINTANFTATINPNGVIIGIVLKPKNLEQEIRTNIAVPLEVPVIC